MPSSKEIDTLSFFASNKGDKEINLRYLNYYPSANPFTDPKAVPLKGKYVRSATTAPQLFNDKGERLKGLTFHHIMEQVDEAQFVKIFFNGLVAMYSLSKTAMRVLIVLVAIYESTPMKGGYSDHIEIFLYKNKLNNYTLDMCTKTFQTGLKELIAKNFIAARNPATYWINPAMFFKGDRLVFIREVTKKAKHEELADQETGEIFSQPPYIEHPRSEPAS